MFKTISLCFLAFALIGQIFAADSDDKNIICRQAKDHGDKDCQDPKGGSLFYFDTITFHCQPFAFAGCSGNENRFATLEECKANCGQIKPIPKPNPKILAVPKCPDGIRSAVDPEARVLNCSAGDACPDGYKCSGDLCCPSSKATVCEVEYDTGRYQAAIPKHSPLYYYDNSIDNCKIFSYLGALGNANNFATYNECMNYCSKRRNARA